VFNEQRHLRRLYCWSFALRFSLGVGGWLLTQFAEVPLLQDALYYEEVGASIARDWLSGRSSVWLETDGQRPHQPVLLVTFIGCFYVLTLGVRALPLLLAFYCAVTALTPPLTYRIAREIGAAPSASLLSAWLVAVCPAFVFWCGALYKEGLVLLVLNLGIYHAFRLQATWRARSFCVLALCLLGLSALRLYLAFLVALALCPALLLARDESGRPQAASRDLMMRPLVTAVFALVIVAVGLAVGVQRVLPSGLEHALYRIQISRDDLAHTASGYLPDATVHTTHDAARFLPLGVAHFLAVPLPWQTGSLRQNLAIPDTALWLLLYPVILLGMARALRRNFQGSVLLVATTVGLCLFYALLIGNVGAAYRLRTQVWLLWAPFVALGWEALRPRRMVAYQVSYQDGQAS